MAPVTLLGAVNLVVPVASVGRAAAVLMAMLMDPGTPWFW